MYKKILANILIAGLLLTGCSTISTAQVISHTSGYQAPYRVIEEVMPTVVTVISEIDKKDIVPKINRFTKPGERPSTQPEQSQYQSGSGFVIDPIGIIITNYHVISNVIKGSSTIGTVNVMFSNEAIYETKIFNYDKTSDIAILKIVNDDNKIFKSTTWGPKPKLGGHAIIIGSPIGLDFSVTFGIISAIDRIIPKAAPPFVPYIQTDASMNRGNSGGPLFDAHGRVIGINTLILTPPSTPGVEIGSVGLGFSIDGTYAKNIVDRLSTGKKIIWSYLGIHYRLLNMEETKSNGLEFGRNVIVVKVTKDGAAFKNLYMNDIIKKMNGVIVTHKTFATMIASLEPGAAVSLEVLRDSQVIDINLTLVSRPS
tara:strand:- start:1217 stop:2323 length:1107 start_codon:yes stop_codon:yes gene_type:complete